MTFGSLFSGIGGFDLGFERAGLTCSWQLENDAKCNDMLAKHWPNVKRYGDVKDVGEGLEPVDLICGGDPCPAHSRASSIWGTRHPDLAGYFLALVGRLRPQWLVRENVPSPTIDHFDAGLAALGYGTVIVRVDAAKITGQSRQRDFTVGCYQVSRQNTASIFSDCENGSGSYTTRLGTRQIAPALTTHRTRYDSRDCYIYEGERLRILDSDERETLAGFPSGWTAGFSEATRARMCGNAVVPQVAEWIGKRITAVEVL